MTFQIEEEKKTQSRLEEDISQLHNKIKSFQNQLEDAEETASSSMAKYRLVQHQLETAEGRLKEAELQLTKQRARNRRESET